MLGVSAPSESFKPQPANSDRSERSRQPTGQEEPAEGQGAAEQRHGTQPGPSGPHWPYGALPDNGRSILHVSNCKFKMQQILFKMSRIFGNKEDSLFLFISNFLLYHHNFLFHKITERPRTGTAQSRGLDPAPAGRTSMGSPHRAPQR